MSLEGIIIAPVIVRGHLTTLESSLIVKTKIAMMFTLESRPSAAAGVSSCPVSFLFISWRASPRPGTILKPGGGPAPLGPGGGAGGGGGGGAGGGIIILC